MPGRLKTRRSHGVQVRGFAPQVRRRIGGCTGIRQPGPASMSSRRGCGWAGTTECGTGRPPQAEAEYDALAKLANNENNCGIPDSVMKAMKEHWKYAGRYGYPKPASRRRSRNSTASSQRTSCSPPARARCSRRRNGVPRGRQEGGRRGADLQFGLLACQQIKSDAIKIPLTTDYRQDIGRSSTRPRSTRARSGSSTSATRTTRRA